LGRDTNQAVNELRRVTRPGGLVICDTANRCRTALDLARDGALNQVLSILDTGQFARPDGLTDHRFSPQELHDLFEAREMTVRHVVAVCPFFDFLPSRAQASILDDETAFEIMQEVGRRYAETPSIVALSGRLLIVAQRAA
jgi:hypothetical protein